ncbi:MAG: DUF1499 domain-containing protein [Proteobacteria bacterium]|nr:DUF1499 domain-containing protein [Pseudomonadota bacterium]
MRARPRRLDSSPARRALLRAARLGVAVAAAAAVAAALSGLGYRWGWWRLGEAFSLLRWAVYAGLLGAGLSLLGIAAVRRGAYRRGLLAAALGLAIGLGVAWVPLSLRQAAEGLPRIHDVTTDTEDPPRFEAVLPLRAKAPNPAAYGGPAVARQQLAAYPDIAPARLAAPPAAAFAAALAAAEDMGWRIVAADAGAGRIEATATTFWFGFEDDVVVRVRAEDGGSRVDARSVSRVGGGDLGTNARRLRGFLARLRGRLAAGAG